MNDVPEAVTPGQTRIAVAVATFQRPAGVRALLRALERQTLPAEQFEVVIVDDASGDETPALLDEERRRSPLNIQVVRLDQNSGPAVARNTAWQRSSAPIVAFTDDDCMPTPSWLEAGLRAIEQEPCVLVGATEPDPAQRHLLGPLARTMHVTRPTFAPTCNVFYRRSDLEAVGGFDERFRVPVGEDTDLAWRINERTGLDLRFAQDALVYHDVRVRSFAQAVKETQRWVGIPRVVARHRTLARRAWHARYFLRPSHPRVILAAFGLAAALVFPAAIVLTLPWLRHRVFPGQANRTWATNLRYAPAVFAIDALEVWVLAKGSLRHRALIL